MRKVAVLAPVEVAKGRKGSRACIQALSKEFLLWRHQARLRPTASLN